MASLYDELGAPPSADQDQLRRAYRARARQLHPDVTDGGDDDSAMQRLNAAWAVLGDPAARVRYDRQLQDDAARARSPGPAQPSPGPEPAPRARHDEPSLGAWGGLFRLFRPSVIIPVVLFAIFVVTAYAGHPGPGGTAPLQPSTSTTTSPGHAPSGTGVTAVTVPAAAFVGKCIRDQSGGSVLLVPCSDRPNSLVIATVPISGRCPAGTSGYVLAGQTEMICASPTGQ